MEALRVRENVLRQQEVVAVRYCVRHAPDWWTPDGLTLFSLAGALVAGASLAACNISAWFLLAVLGGLFCNWFGDSLDGALARRRRVQRPRSGYLIDHGADVISFAAIILGLGLSPYLSVFSALALLTIYLLHTIYVLLRNIVDGVQIIGLGGVGATEGRILAGLWALFAQAVGPDVTMLRIGGYEVVDVFYVVFFTASVVAFARRIVADVARIDAKANTENVVALSARSPLRVGEGGLTTYPMHGAGLHGRPSPRSPER